MSLHGALRETGAGALVGAGCLTLTVACVAALGGYHLEGIGAAASDTFFAKKPRTPLHPKPDCAIMGVRGSIAERLGGVR